MDSEGLKGALKVTKMSCRTNYAVTLIFAVIWWLKDIVYLLFANMGAVYVMFFVSEMARVPSVQI